MKLPHAFSLLFSSAILLSACSSETPSSNGISTMPAMPSANAAPASAGVDANSSAQLNPPHGEPGHVCEIPVGQPLDGSGGTTVPDSDHSVQMDGGANFAPQTMTIPSATGSSAITLPSGTPNPAHGEPGHVCAVSVGDPLP